MPDPSYQLNAVCVFECPAQGPGLASAGDAPDLIGKAAEVGATLVVIPFERARTDFFDLRTVPSEPRHTPIWALSKLTASLCESCR